MEKTYIVPESIVVGPDPARQGTPRATYCPKCEEKMTFGMAGNWFCFSCTHDNYVNARKTTNKDK